MRNRMIEREESEPLEKLSLELESISINIVTSRVHKIYILNKIGNMKAR